MYKAEILAQIYYKQSGDECYDKAFQNFKAITESDLVETEDNNNGPLNQPITREELEEALQSLKDGSPGPDNISNAFLRELPESAKVILLNLFNEIIKTQKYPEQWQKAIIVPIKKSNKPKSDPTSYRPISLLCTLPKLLDKIVNRRLVWFLETNNLLANNQNGFRPHRSTLDNIIDLESIIQESFANKHKCLAIFFDINKATVLYGVTT